MEKLSDREWTVLDALWKTGGAELGALVEALRPATGWNRNTVLTYLTRMEAKGLVEIEKMHPLTSTGRCSAVRPVRPRSGAAFFSGSTRAAQGT